MIGLGFGNFQSVTQEPFSFGNALDYDGTNDNVSFSPISLNDFTANIWFKPQIIGGATFRALLTNSNNSSNYILLYNNTGTNSIRVSLTSNSYFNLSAFTLNEWQMLTVTRSGSSVRVYFNGVESSTGAVTLTSNLVSFDRLGSYFTITNNFLFNGDLDEVGVWNTALTQTNITNLYNSGNGDYATNYSPANLQAYWRMNGTSGDSTATDEQGTYNGTLNNFDTATCWVAH